MILGIDLGNYAVKTSEGCIFESKVANSRSILGSKIELIINKKQYYLGEGSFDTEYRKVYKVDLKKLLVTAAALSTPVVNNQIVLGLPLSQYKEDRDVLKHLLLQDRLYQFELNNEPRKLIIEDVEVFAEGVASIIGTDFEGVIVDIGGRTTDVALITGQTNKKVNDPFSLPKGTLNLYKDFIDSVNSKHGLDLKPEDTERLLKKGLKIYGEDKDISFGIDVFKDYVESLVREIQVQYSLKTYDVLLIGGGSKLLYKPFLNRIPNVEINDDIFSNAKGYKRVGESIWQ